MSLHNKIMNLPCDVAAKKFDSFKDYAHGHRDARHAAADLAHEADNASDRASLTIIALTERVEKQGATIAQLVEALEHCRDWLNSAGIAKTMPVQQQARAALAAAKEQQ